ncbi:MAG: carboxypeptidase-like regulatory domain-containing protein [Bacteroidota bacterium]
MKLISYFAFLSFSIYYSFAGTIKGRVMDHHNEPLPGVTIKIKGTNKGGISDADGRYSIEVNEGAYVLEASFIGFETRRESVSVPGTGVVTVDFRMNEAVSELEEVIVKGKSVTQLKREEPIKVEAIDVSKTMAQSTSIPELINQVTGVKVRQASGVGSNVDININGLQGNAIRFFKDGIPTDYLGGAFRLGLVPTSIIDNVEIYKGVLPIELGADALGGAVNITTKEKDQNYLDASYEIGSFNTHTVNLNANHILPNSNVHVGVSSYFIHSDNDYEFDLDINEGGITETYRVRRFHDATTARYGAFNLGLHDAPWADVLDVTFTYFDQDDEVQNGIQVNPSQALGEVVRASTSTVFDVRYRKEVLPGWDVDVFAAISQRDTKEQDLADFFYDWRFGRTDNRTSNGETELRDQRLDIDTKVARFITQYTLNDHFKLKFSSTYNGYDQVGSDPFQQANLSTDVQPITIPSTYTKVVSGFGIRTSFLDNKLKGESFVKHYYLDAEAPSTFGTSLTQKISRENFGWGQSIKYEIDGDSYARVSFEDATRIPEAEEYFGDFLFVLPNGELEPEQSKNLNFGFKTNLDELDDISVEINAFYRKTTDFIRLFPIDLLRSVNRNSDAQLTNGIETNFKWNVLRATTIRAAITYQDMRRTETSGTDVILENSRTPNIPYFFTNLSVRSRFDDPLSFPISLSVYGNYLFTEKYLLLPTPEALEPTLFSELLPAVSNNFIPTQQQVNVGLTCAFKALPVSANVEVINLTNAVLFDNFRIQKPGRNYRFKLTYRL